MYVYKHINTLYFFLYLIFYMLILLTAVPSASPEIFTAHNLTSTSIQLKWHPPSPESQNGHIQNYTVLVFNMNLTTNTTYMVQQTYFDLVDLHPFSVYECAVAASTAVGLGPFTTWLSFQTNEDRRLCMLISFE